MFSLMRSNIKNKLIPICLPNRKSFNLIQNDYSVWNNNPKRHFMQKFSSLFKKKEELKAENSEKYDKTENAKDIFSEEEMAKEKEEDTKLREEINKKSVLEQMEVKKF